MLRRAAFAVTLLAAGAASAQPGAGPDTAEPTAPVAIPQAPPARGPTASSPIAPTSEPGDPAAEAEATAVNEGQSTAPDPTPSTMPTWWISPRAPIVMDDVIAGDAAADRGFVFGTGAVLDRGEIDASLRTVITYGSNISAAVGLGHGLEVSADGTDAFGGRYKSAGAQVRLRLAKRRDWELAAFTGYHWTKPDLAGDDPFIRSYVSVGIDWSAVIGNGSMFSFGVGLLPHYGVFGVPSEGDVVTSSSLDWTPSAHFDMTLSQSHFRPLLEIGYMGKPVMMLGFRIATRHVSVDLAGAMTSTTDVTDQYKFVVAAIAVRP